MDRLNDGGPGFRTFGAALRATRGRERAERRHDRANMVMFSWLRPKGVGESNWERGRAGVGGVRFGGEERQVRLSSSKKPQWKGLGTYVTCTVIGRAKHHESHDRYILIRTSSFSFNMHVEKIANYYYKITSHSYVPLRFFKSPNVSVSATQSEARKNTLCLAKNDRFFFPKTSITSISISQSIK